MALFLNWRCYICEGVWRRSFRSNRDINILKPQVSNSEVVCRTRARLFILSHNERRGTKIPHKATFPAVFPTVSAKFISLHIFGAYLDPLMSHERLRSLQKTCHPRWHSPPSFGQQIDTKAFTQTFQGRQNSPTPQTHQWSTIQF